jgi:hypothetical protein
MDDKPLNKGVQESSTRGMQASPSIGWCSGYVNPTNEQQSKNRDDLDNAKYIRSFLLDYIPPLAGAINHNNIPCDYEYTLFTKYIPKGIRVVASQLGQISLLKNIDFNLGNRNNYAMLAPHRYLTKTTGKKPCLVSQP